MLQGALIVTVISVLVAMVSFNAKNVFIRLALVAVATYTAAYCVYWAPVWGGATDDQYSSWAPMVIYPWFFIGTLVGSFVVGISTWLKHKNISTNGN